MSPAAPLCPPFSDPQPLTLQVAENVHAVLVQAVQHVPKKWANVRGVFLKTTDSVALPLFQCLPEHAGTRIEPAAGASAGAASGAVGAVAAPQGKSQQKQKPAAVAAGRKAAAGVSIAGKGRPAVQAPATPGAKKMRKA